ncbi:hypothetical protein [Streptomyces sp. NPDC047070]|uniref:hypothetical protein n=1 Tax=Streptomyces sp. NPDC047070 TaxID=3154923 RepID=UPI003452E2E4
MKQMPEADVHRAAAALYNSLRPVPDLEDADPFLCRSKEWHRIEQDPASRREHRKQVLDLVAGAADVSEWAVELGQCGLKPFETYAWKSENAFDLAVQIAANAALNPAQRRELIRAVHAAVEGTYRRFFGMVPACESASTR